MTEDSEVGPKEGSICVESSPTKGSKLYDSTKNVREIQFRSLLLKALINCQRVKILLAMNVWGI